MTGAPESHVIGIGKSSFRRRPEFGISRPGADIFYWTSDPKFPIKHLSVDNQLIARLLPQANQGRTLVLHNIMREIRHNPQEHEFLNVYLDADHVVIAGDIDRERPFITDGISYTISLKELGRFPLKAIPTLALAASPQVTNLWTNTLPCIHCLKTIQNSGVANLHIEELDWSGFKGDDGLVLEYLMTQFTGETPVARHR